MSAHGGVPAWPWHSGIGGWTPAPPETAFPLERSSHAPLPSAGYALPPRPRLRRLLAPPTSPCRFWIKDLPVQTAGNKRKHETQILSHQPLAFQELLCVHVQPDHVLISSKCVFCYFSAVPRPPHAEHCVWVQKIHRQLKEKVWKRNECKILTMASLKKKGTWSSKPALIRKAGGTSQRKGPWVII